jgi:dimethylhistidine N-methyltransferase
VTDTDDARLAAEALRGLRATPKRLPSKLLYDERGAALFEAITALPEYYPTRTEIAILRQHAPAIARWIGPGARVVEFGSGRGEKARLLLSALTDPAEYVPVDIAEPQLLHLAESLRADFPGLAVQPVSADFTQQPELPAPEVAGRGRTIVFFPGSTIGNFEPAEAGTFLRYAAHVAGPGGGLLIGADLQKDIAVLERAYDDAAGVTAAFDLNVLQHVNRLLGADFDPESFRHRALYDPDAGRIEMHLVSTTPQRVRLRPPGGAEVEIDFAAGEPIVTEYSYKYTPDGFAALAGSAGFVVRQRWSDDAGWFGVFAFDRAAPD